MRSVLLILITSLTISGCSNEARRDADPCVKATANARRLATTEPGVVQQYGAEPLALARCRTLASREEVACLGYASSWKELAACSPGAIRPAADVATKP